jgi:hypothetical protein
VYGERFLRELNADGKFRFLDNASVVRWVWNECLHGKDDHSFDVVGFILLSERM